MYKGFMIILNQTKGVGTQERVYKYERKKTHISGKEAHTNEKTVYLGFEPSESYSHLAVISGRSHDIWELESRAAGTIARPPPMESFGLQTINTRPKTLDDI